MPHPNKRTLKVLDVGCGVGGPLREIAAFTGASITGLNNNQHQVERGTCIPPPIPPHTLNTRDATLEQTVDL
jgi:SAM-dependent methyltransferase